MQTQLLESLIWSSFDKYDGVYDPTTQVEAYLTQATLVSDDLWIHCHLFPTTLKSIALEWYYVLPPLSIDSFDTLCERFTTRRFANCKPITTNLLSLLHVNDKMSRYINT